MTLHVEPGNLRALRKRIDMTQVELSRLSGVSQSMIAKIESGSAEPSYRSMRAIEDALNTKRKRSMKKAVEIMSGDILSFTPTFPLDRAIEMMTEKGYSQAPVMRDERPVGTVTERSIMNALRKAGRKGDLTVMDAMTETLPTVPASTTVDVIFTILGTFDAVLVEDHGCIVGIITRTDLIRTRGGR